MGEADVLPVARTLIALAAALGLTAAGFAQGVAYRERWGYLHLEARRAEVWQELAGRDAATTDRVAALLVAPDDGIPFTPVAQALATLRGVAMDPAFLLRCAIGAYVLPEVCDPDAANEVCRSTHVSLFVPFAVPHPAPVTFAVRVLDGGGEVAWQATVERDCGERDVRQARPHVEIPGAGLRDGAYTLEVRTLLDGVPPRPHDPICRWTIHVLRGYQARAERAMGDARGLADTLPPPARAVLLGALGEVHRAYTGEAFAVASDAVRDLDRLERVVANAVAKEPIAAGLDGPVRLALPVAGGLPLGAVLRRATGKEPRPLVVVVAGTPAFQPGGVRPSAPATRDPGWTARELAALGVREDWHLVCLESPGLGRDFAPALREALPLLGTIAGAGPGKPLLVAEREAASIVGLRIGDYRDAVAGLVLVGGGAMAGPALLANGALPVRYVALRGVPEESLTRVLEFVALQQGKPEWRGDVAWLTAARPAWPCALPQLAAPLATFAATVFAR